MSMSKPQFVYVTYISTTPEKLWNALTDGELTKQYWVRHRNASDWKPGSPWRHEDYDNPNLVDIAGQVVESTPPRRLVLTWANPSELADPAKVSRVTFEIEPFKGVVRLTVTHEELEPGSQMAQGHHHGLAHGSLQSEDVPGNGHGHPHDDHSGRLALNPVVNAVTAVHQACLGRALCPQSGARPQSQPAA